MAYGNGTTQSYSYSKAGDLETHTHTITGNSNTWTNSYTKAHQLLSEAASNAAWVFQPAVNETTSYGSANNLNQYVTVTHAANPTTTLYYDGNGNLIDDGAWDFEYDAENRLTKASNATTGTTALYLYDPMGRRQAKIVGSVTTSFLSDGAEEIAEYDGAGGLLRRYIPGPGTDQPIAMVTPSGSSHLHSYFHTNRQGSTVAMSNDAGTVSEGPYTYDAYGQGAPSTGVPFKYTGRRLDPETGLYYYRARYYSAALGRFLQTDPIGYADQMNLYGYVNNDPGNATDPSGMQRICVTQTRRRHCVDAGGDDDKETDDDLSEDQIAAIRRDFAGAIVANSGRDIRPYGKSVQGSESTSNKNMLRAVSQFVGAAISRAGGQIRHNWARIDVIGAELPGQLMSVNRMAPWLRPPAFMSTDLRTMMFTGHYEGRNFFGSPSNVARLMIHEAMHRGDDWTDFGLFHIWMDEEAKKFMNDSGLGGGGCWQWRGFFGC